MTWAITWAVAVFSDMPIPLHIVRACRAARLNTLMRALHIASTVLEREAVVVMLSAGQIYGYSRGQLPACTNSMYMAWCHANVLH